MSSYHQPETTTNATTGVSQGIGPGLQVTDEEKKLLELEGLKIPEDAHLTNDEEKSLKKVRRKIKNKQSAMKSRSKRKEYIDNLEQRVKHCTDVNNGLRKKVDKLNQENKSLVNQLKAMKEIIGLFQETQTPSKGEALVM
jgi:cyclic AMP-responsive element-binding protein 3